METQELRKGDQSSIERDRELPEMSSKFAELQTLFDEVSHQLFRECKRIEGVQETVNACVKQSKEKPFRARHSKKNSFGVHSKKTLPHTTVKNP